MGLEEVVHFLAESQLEGTLEVRRGEAASLRLYFRPDGSLFFPWSARRGTYSLGKILRHTGLLSREALEKYLEEVRRRRKAELLQAETDQAALEEARRRQSTEELQDLFLWRDVRFEFRPEPLPPRVEQDLAAGRGLRLDPKGLLFEVARRADERRRIRQAIPSSRAVLRGRPGAEERVIAALRAIGVDADRSPLQGEDSLDELLERWGVPHHAALTTVTGLVETGEVHLLPLEAARERARQHLAAGDLRAAGRLLGHLVELERRGPGGTRPGLEQELVRAPAFRDGPEVTCRVRLGGARAYLLARTLLAGDAPFTLELHESGRAVRLGGQPGEVALSGDLEGGASPQGADADALARRLAGELCRIGWWADVDAELRNRGDLRPLAPRAASTSGAPVLSFPLPDLGARARLAERLDRWAEVLADLPAEEVVLLPGDKSCEGEPAARFFLRFGLGQSAGELRRQAKVDRLEFAAFVSRGLRRGYLRRPTPYELETELAAARAEGNEPRVGRLLRAAAALGLSQEVPGATQAGGPAPLLDPEPVLEGDLDGVGLAAILQALRDQRRTGTLFVRAHGREERLLFHRGDAFLLRETHDPEAAEFAAFLLGEEGSDELSALAELAPGAHGEPSAAEQRALQDGVLDLLFWEGASFAFHQDDLPEGLFGRRDGAQRVALDTRAFLLEAIQAMTEWDRHRQAIPSRAAVLRWKDGAKSAALRAHPGQEQLLLPVDGRRSFDELLRVSGAGVLEAARVLAPLVQAGQLEVVAAAPPAEGLTTPPPPAGEDQELDHSLDELLG